VTTRRSPDPEGWEIIGNHDLHQLMRCAATNDKKARCQFVQHKRAPFVASSCVPFAQIWAIETLNTVYIERDIWPSTYSLPRSILRVEISLLFGHLNVPLDSGERPGVQNPLKKILAFDRSGPKLTLGSPQCSLSRRQVSYDLLEEGKEILAHALKTYRRQPSVR
jgi:hypothetical protein